MSELQNNLTLVLDKINSARERSSFKSKEVKLVAAVKKQPAEVVLEYIELAKKNGISPIIGDNYVQEYEEHKAQLTNQGDYESHLIGHLQRNKAKRAVELFDVIEGVDSERLLLAIQKEGQKVGKKQRVFFQVNISNDPAKSGMSVEELKRLASDQLPICSHVSWCGLMTITENYDDLSFVREDYRAMRALYDEIQSASFFNSVINPNAFDLSMGMSGDYEIGIEEGATMVRIGTALFGTR